MALLVPWLWLCKGVVAFTALSFWLWFTTSLVLSTSLAWRGILMGAIGESPPPTAGWTPILERMRTALLWPSIFPKLLIKQLRWPQTIPTWKRPVFQVSLSVLEHDAHEWPDHWTITQILKATFIMIAWIASAVARMWAIPMTGSFSTRTIGMVLPLLAMYVVPPLWSYPPIQTNLSWILIFYSVHSYVVHPFIWSWRWRCFYLQLT